MMNATDATMSPGEKPMLHTMPRIPLAMSSLATCLALVLALDNDPAVAATRGASMRQSIVAAPASAPSPQVSRLPVGNCDDDGGPETLRSVVAGAGSGDIIDLTALTCSTISLANGAIAVPVENLKFEGPGSTLLTLDAQQSYRRIIEHTGTGLLHIQGLRLTGGWAGIGSAAYGGCVYSAGSVELDDSAVVYCKAVSGPGQSAAGGGIYAAGSLQLRHSILSGNSTNPGSSGYGGGAFAGAGLYVDYSTVSDNYSINLYGGGGFGGGLFTFGNVNIFASTISRNHAVNVGGISIAGYAISAVIVESTISGNLASQFIGGVYSNTPLAIYDSTIAFNDAAQQSSTFVTAGGLQVYATSVDLQSSIIAGNTAAGFSFDVGIEGGASVTGANNLIRTASNLMPADTITDDPQLGALQNNGGETATHALAATSPALDHGNNASSAGNDQRGLGYVRIFGAAADIGAYELQVTDDDLLFRDGFDPGM
ncbi:MAG: choice-of-anchor Q domain-containing protein [Rhodanobacteraceae bacterium]